MQYDHQADPSVVFVTYSQNEDEPGGYYDPGTPDRLYINTENNLLESEQIYWHEDKHRQCHASKCFCFNKKTDYWAEYHAFRYEFEKMIACPSDALRRSYAGAISRSVKKYIAYEKLYPTHLKALRKLFKTAAFRKFACEYKITRTVNRVIG